MSVARSANVGFYAAVPGATTHGSVAPRIAAGAILATMTTLAASASVALRGHANEDKSVSRMMLPKERKNHGKEEHDEDSRRRR